MYSPLDAQLIAARQHEIDAGAVHAHHRRELLDVKRAPRRRTSRPTTRGLRVRLLAVVRAR
jgi:hypothetical protein